MFIIMDMFNEAQRDGLATTTKEWGETSGDKSEAGRTGHLCHAKQSEPYAEGLHAGGYGSNSQDRINGSQN